MAGDVFFEAGRAIRPHLPELLGAAAPGFDGQLLQLLRSSDATDTEGDLADLFRTTDATHAWVASFLETGLPPEVVPLLERSSDSAGYEGLAGNIVAAVGERYACPVDELFVWYRVEVSQEIPDCPDHPGQTLVHRP